MLMAGLIGTLTLGMENPLIILCESKKTFTVKQIQDAYLKFAHWRIIPSKENEKFLSENLFALSINWSDQLGVVGLTLAKTLIEKGANPHYTHIEEEELATKSRKMIVSYTQTPARVARGKLQEYLKAYDLDLEDGW